MDNKYFHMVAKIVNISSQHCNKKKIADRRKELEEGENVEEVLEY